MAVFLVTPLAHNGDQIGEAIKKHIPEVDRFELQNRAGWLVSFHGTTVTLSHLLGIAGSEEGFKPLLGSAMVTAISSYYGRGPTTMWEWLKLKFEGT